jgi:hypothetical protein
MRGHNRGAGGARLLHRRGRPVVQGDQATQPDSDGMTSAVRVRVVVSELETRHQQHPVGRERTSALALDRREVSADVRGIDARARVPKRPRVVAAQDMVRDTEDVEAGPPVEVDHRPQRKLPIAPARVGVQLAQQWAPASAHNRHRARSPSPGG